MTPRLVGSEMCIRDRTEAVQILTFWCQAQWETAAVQILLDAEQRGKQRLYRYSLLGAKQGGKQRLHRYSLLGAEQGATHACPALHLCPAHGSDLHINKQHHHASATSVSHWNTSSSQGRLHFNFCQTSPCSHREGCSSPLFHQRISV